MLAAVLVAFALTGGSTAFAQSGTVTAGKTVGATDIPCDGSTRVTVTLDAQTGLAGTPSDIELVLDRSGSMAGTPLANLKTAAKQFVDLVDEATDGTLDGTIANGSRIGVVSFSSSATVDQPLTGNANAVKADIDALVAGGNTNHSDAIATGQGQLAGSQPANAKKMIIFTDGRSVPTSADGLAAASSARAAGTEIFAIGLGNVNVGQLDAWATDPDAQHVFVAPDSGDLDAIFQAIGAAITVPAATDVKVVDTVHPHFAVSGVAASKGSVAQSGNQLTWTIPELGTEKVALTYLIAHDPSKPGGAEEVNSSITYADAEGKSVTFPSPVVNVRGCAAAIDLTPPTATNELGTPGQTHTVTGTVRDDFGDPVAAVAVGYDILSGPNAGAAGSDSTDAAGESTFTYPATQGPAGLGTDVIEGCFTNGAGDEVCDRAEKRWVDTTAPEPACSPTTNPHGKNEPRASNEDGFFRLTATDAVDPDPQLFVRDAGSGEVFGPYPSGTRIKYTQAPGAQPREKKIGSANGQASAVTVHLTGRGDAEVIAQDASGNRSDPVSCLVAPPPK